MTAFVINGGAINSQAWNGPGIDLNPTPDHVILFNQTTIELDWTSIPNAFSWDIEVSLFPDFRTVFESANVSSSEHSFTDGATDNQRRYWRVRPKDSFGDFLEPWSEVASYWLDTSAPEQIKLDRNTWAIAGITDTSDVYEFDLFPVYNVTPVNLFRFKGRNRLGELLSETLTVKDRLTLQFDREQFIEHQQMDELQRFNNQNLTFYLVTFKDGLCERPFPHIWKAQFERDPILSMISAGRPDLVQGTLLFEEV